MPPATTSGQALQNLSSYTNSMQSPQQAFDQANAQYNIPQQNQQVQGLRQSVQNTQNLLSQIAPSVMGRTANSLVDNAQATRMIANEQAPLNATLSKENTDYANANQDYQNSLSEASQLANAELAGQSQKQSYLQGIYNDLYTQEQNAAQLAAEKQAIAASGSSGANPTFGNQGVSATGDSTGGPTVYSQFGADLQKYLPSDYATKYLPGYTERTLIPLLERTYPEFNQQQITNAVYGYRKQYETPTPTKSAQNVNAWLNFLTGK
jgi:hypothetical protein